MIDLAFLDRARFEDAQRIGGVAVVPIRGDAVIPPPYVVGSEALAKGVVEVTEVPGAAAVGRLAIHNRLELPVLFVEGEELVGGMQNRVVNVTVMAAPKSTTELPVSCVEKGRWHRDTREHRHSGRVIDRTIRAEKVHSLAVDRQARLDHVADQELVWDLVEESLDESGIESMTMAAYDGYRDRAGKLSEWKKRIRVFDDQFGFAAVSADGMLGVEMVRPARAFRALFPLLLDSYLVECVGAAGGGRRRIPSRVNLRDELGEELEVARVKGVSLGNNVYAVWESCVGHGLFYGGSLVQFSILRQEKRGSWRTRRHARASDLESLLEEIFGEFPRGFPEIPPDHIPL